MLIRRPATSTSRSGVVPLVWYQARRRASDPAHTTERILEGLQMGARVGIDIYPMSDGHFAVLHGPMLDRETTGLGPVIRSRAADLAGLQRRDQDGGTIQEAPFTLAALAEAVGTGARGFLHITLRCGDEALRPGHEVGFARALRSLADQVVLSGRDVTGLRRLSDALPGLRLGLVLADETAEWLRRTGDAEAFATRVIEAIPEAAKVQLNGLTILALDNENIGLVRAFQARGWLVEAQANDADTRDADLWEVVRLVSLGVDGIVTDDSEGLLAALAGHPPPSGLGGRLPPGRTERQADGRPAEAGWRSPKPRTAA